MDEQAPVPAPIVPSPTPMPPMSKKGMGMWLWVIIAVVVVVAYAVFAAYADMWPFSQSVAPSASPSPTASATVDTTGWQTYTNTQYGIELKLPPIWSGYQVTVIQYPNWKTLCFDVHQAGEQGYCIFQLVIFTPAQYQATEVSQPTVPAPIARNDSYVIVADYNTEGGGQFSDFQTARAKEVPEILTTFKLTK